MKRCLLVLLLLPVVALGQTRVLRVKPAFIKAVNTYDFNKVESFIDSLNNIKTNSGSNKSEAYFKVNREVVSGYSEFIVEITEYYDSPDSDGAMGEAFKFCFIVKGKQIVLSAVAQGGEYWDSSYSITPFYKNDSLYSTFKGAFLADFDAPLDTAGLFNEAIAYGKHCGIAGVNPHWKTVTDSLVENNNRAGLMALLQSSITEKQIYGVEGFQALKDKGVVLTDTELRIIKNVLRKKGNVQTCSGCMHMDEKIEIISKKFNF